MLHRYIWVIYGYFLIASLLLSSCSQVSYIQAPNLHAPPQISTPKGNFSQSFSTSEQASSATPAKPVQRFVSQPGPNGSIRSTGPVVKANDVLYKSLTFTIDYSNLKGSQSKGFRTQALRCQDIATIKVQITGINIGTPLYPAGVDGNDHIPAPSGCTVAATINNVPFGTARIATVEAFAAGPTLIAGSKIMANFDVSLDPTNVEISYKSTNAGDVMNQIITNPNSLLAAYMDTNALQTLVDAITGVTGTFPDYSYTYHPTLVDTSQLATDLLGNNGNSGALTAGDYDNELYSTVTGTLAGLISTDTASIQVTDPASGISINNPNGAFSFTNNVKNGTWVVYAEHPNYTADLSPGFSVGAGASQGVGTITFTWTNTPNIGGLVPATGIIGDSIVINGTDFHPTTGGNVVKFNGVTATVTAASPTQLTVTVPAGTTDGNVTVQVGTKLSTGVAFDVDLAPGITSLTPSKNPVLGQGYPIEIVVVATDDNALADGNYSWSCTANCTGGSFNRTDSDTVVYTVPITSQGGDTTIQVTVDDGANTPINSSVNITITDGTGDVVFTSNLGILPTITGLSAPSAQVGTTISINGINFHANADGNLVMFGTIAVPTGDITVVSDTQLDVKVPFGANGGPTTITVSTGAQLSNSQAFTVLPTVDSITPTSGDNANSVPVIIWGSGFQAGATVDIGTTVANSVVLQSNNRLSATIPAGIASGVYGVKITNADLNNHTLADAYTSILGSSVAFAGSAGLVGTADGTGAAARFDLPSALAIDSLGNTFVADRDNHTIRKITPAGVVTTFAGSAGLSGTADGTGGAARFDLPSGIAVDASDNLYVADRDNHTIRKITPAGVVTTFAGSAGLSGTADGTGAAARFELPTNLEIDSLGNIFVADRDNHTIRKITPAGVVTTFAGSAGLSGTANGTGAAARFELPNDIAIDASDNLYVADRDNHTIRKITPAGVVTTFAGSAGLSGTADGTGAAARFELPSGIAIDSASGLIIVADRDNHTIRKITPGGVVTTLAGLAGTSGYAEGVGTAARFNLPTDVEVFNGIIYVVDRDNHIIRKLTL